MTETLIAARWEFIERKARELTWDELRNIAAKTPRGSGLLCGTWSDVVLAKQRQEKAMAQPTTSHPASTPPQAATPGMGTSPASMAAPGKTPPAAATAALDPVLAEGIDPVLLHRLYPEADSIADAGAKALEQGKKTAAEGAAIVAVQQVPPEPVR